MFFIGQEHIMPTLGDALIYTYETKKGISVLFRGASGYGKTDLAKKSCNFLVGQNYQYSLGSNLDFDETKFVHLIDEIHLAKEPEILYPIIDSGKYTFIFATNFDSILPEALVNRCKSFIFSDYNDDELIRIFKFHSTLDFSEEVIRHIINVSGRCPRVMIKTFLNNMEVYYKNRKQDIAFIEDADVINTINKIHGIVDGLDKTSRDYLEVLTKLGGRASINLISATLRLDINTIKYTVEPALLYKNLIKITQKGREIVNVN